MNYMATIYFTGGFNQNLGGDTIEETISAVQDEIALTGDVSRAFIYPCGNEVRLGEPEAPLWSYTAEDTATYSLRAKAKALRDAREGGK